MVAEAYTQYLAMDKKLSHFIDVNGIRMHYLEWGDKEGTPLIWAHGYSSSPPDASGMVCTGYDGTPAAVEITSRKVRKAGLGQGRVQTNKKTDNVRKIRRDEK